ncbi:hypothetical protein I3843_16G004500 [Carya illinoinensis]|nr:hypothetical protein I3843_16G004500 [Carya illinoinensis]
MASESHDSRRKHRRSSSSEDDAERSSKRHKHHHHHRHRHRSKKRDAEDIIAAPPPPVAIRNSRADDDVEEGEILEDEGFDFGGGEHEIAERKPQSDDESREIVAVGVTAPSDQQNSGSAEHGSYDAEARIHEGEILGKKGRSLKTLREDKSKDDFLRNSNLDKEDRAYSQSGVDTDIENEVAFPRTLNVEPQNELAYRVTSEGYGNGDLGFKAIKDKKMWQSESWPPSKGSGKEKTHYDDEKVEVYGSKLSNQGKSSSQSTGDTRSRSRSIDHARGRSRSRSIREEEAHSKKQHYYGRDASLYADRSKFMYDSDDERIVQLSKDGRHYRRDVEREHITGSNKYIGEERLQSQSTRERERSKDREMARELRKEKERNRGVEMDKAQRREKERERSRERDRKRGMERYRSKEREVAKDRQDMERDKIKDNQVDRDGERDKERGRSRASERERDRDREREREKDRDKVWRERDNEREKWNDRNRNRDRGIMIDREKYEYLVDGDRHKNSRYSRYDGKDYHHDRTRKTDSAKVPSSRSELLEGNREKLQRDDDEQGDYEEGTTLQFAEQEEEDLNRIKEESRRRRQAILEKYKSQQLQQPNQPRSEDTEKDKEPAHDSDQSIAANDVITDAGDGRSDGFDIYVAEPSFSVGKSPPQNGHADLEKTSSAGGLGEGSPKSERSGDKFCDDIFGETPTGVRRLDKVDGLRFERSGLNDNWDDAEGYYGYRFGEILDGRYEVTAAHGKGVFSTVVRAKNLKAGNGEPEEVAIKIIRSNDTMYKAGMEELVILKKLVGADPDDKRHCVRFISSFKYRNHLCLVFESLHMNLREVLKKFGRNIGLKLTAVRAYAKQLFIALKHLRNCGVLHCDIKPDNMLVNEAKNVLKLCDFGNAMFAGKNEITPYLVSRFYRAPEIILGMPYDHPLDIWSVGCCLYEIYTGKVLFPGATNNDMLRLHMELKGPFPKKMLRKGAFIDQHFDQDLSFHATEEDPVTKKAIKRMILNIKPKDISSIITGSPGEDPKMLANFKDLLEKIFVLDPDKRMTVSQALSHPFITVSNYWALSVFSMMAQELSTRFCR